MAMVWRDRIAASNILDGLINHFNGRRRMKPTQVRVGLALLGKVLPDLQAIEYRGEMDLNVIHGAPISADQWAKDHVIDGEAKEIAAQSAPKPPSAPVQPTSSDASSAPQSASQAPADPISLAAAMAQEQGPPWRIGSYVNPAPKPDPGSLRLDT